MSTTNSVSTSDGTSANASASAEEVPSSIDQFQRDIWEGCIPIEISLHIADMGCIFPPDPVYMLANRMGYLPLIAKSIIESFKSRAIEFASEARFEAKGVSLKSYLPMGVLYDLYGRSQRQPNQPWRLIMHFSNQSSPSDALDLTSVLLCEKLYFHSLKQALQLLHGTIRPYNELSLEKQATLWQAPVWQRRQPHIWVDFQSIRSELFPARPNIKQLPIRFLIPFNNSSSSSGSSSSSSCSDSSSETFILRQKSVRLQENASGAKNHNYTLRQLLKDNATLFASSCENDILPTVIVQGIVLEDLDVDVVELWQLFCHADLFLYLVINLS